MRNYESPLQTTQSYAGDRGDADYAYMATNVLTWKHSMYLELQQNKDMVITGWAQLSKFPHGSENKVKMTIMLAATCQRSLLGPFIVTVTLCDFLNRWILILPLINVEKEVEALAHGHRARTGTYSVEHPRSQKYRGHSRARARWIYSI